MRALLRDIKRPRFVAIVALLALSVTTVACGDDAGADSTTPTGSATQPTTATPIATSEASAAQTSAPEAQLRAVELPGGTIEVPADPQRVVVLQSFILPHVLSMGVEPVGVGLTDVTVPPNEILPPWPDARLPDDVVVFEETAPDLELIASLEPDLLVAFRADMEGYEQLREIAPVAVIDRIAMEWRELTEGVADVFNTHEQFDEFMSDYEARLEQFRAETLPELGDLTVSAFRVRGPDALRIEVLDSFPGQIWQRPVSPARSLRTSKATPASATSR